jgi:hypothetical protein
MISRQIHQALAAYYSATSGLPSEEIPEFEDATIMACAGLIERYQLESGSQNQYHGLRFIHLSVKEACVEFAETTLRSTEESVSSKALGYPIECCVVGERKRLV